MNSTQTVVQGINNLNLPGKVKERLLRQFKSNKREVGPKVALRLFNMAVDEYVTAKRN